MATDHEVLALYRRMLCVGPRVTGSAGLGRGPFVGLGEAQGGQRGCGMAWYVWHGWGCVAWLGVCGMTGYVWHGWACVPGCGMICYGHDEGGQQL